MAKKMQKYSFLFGRCFTKNCEDCAGVAVDELSVVYYQVAIPITIYLYNIIITSCIDVI